MRLADKRILLGVSGGIAAYKSAELVRRLKDQGAEVRVVMTRSAKEFITPLTLQRSPVIRWPTACWTPLPKRAWAISSWPSGPIWY